MSVDEMNGCNPRQVALEYALVGVAKQFGKFDKTTGNDGAHYVSPSPFGKEGMLCANCIMFEGPRSCEVVDGDISPDAVCKLWVIPERLLSAPERASLLRKHLFT